MELKKKRKIERVNEFHCCKEVFKHPEFIAHLTNVHGFTKGTQCSRSLVQAIDGSDFYSNIFEWQIPLPNGAHVKAQQVSSGPRGKNDLLAGDDE